MGKREGGVGRWFVRAADVLSPELWMGFWSCSSEKVVSGRDLGWCCGFLIEVLNGLLRRCEFAGEDDEGERRSWTAGVGVGLVVVVELFGGRRAECSPELGGRWRFLWFGSLAVKS
ncbi:hypothetical protein KY290_034787 [Solanum tuberosum]|uniref:Uncharacterized protein n=1 Tax=Solanum tuberosum TaxID=4113 RepID=A0ABQ7U472_SOLTU|nr:hypothetical protein KY289_034155 [Solanum tuberosum]KAH0741744.1 hypothetical protein KY290_034787 [Solanum tuberosum]